MWIRHCHNKVHVFLVLKIGMIYISFHTSWVLKNIFKNIHEAVVAYAAYLYISHRSNCKPSLMLIL